MQFTSHHTAIYLYSNLAFPAVEHIFFHRNASRTLYYRRYSNYLHKYHIKELSISLRSQLNIYPF